MSTCTCSPPSRARRKVSVPSSSRARAAMLTSPRCSPDGQATLAARRLRRTSSGRPQPSSEIVSRTRPPPYASRTTARLASACTAVLNSASPAIRNSDCSHSGGQRHRLAADAHLHAQLVRHVHAREPAQHRRQVLVGLALAVVQRVDRRPQLLDGPPREVLGGVEVGAQPGVGDLRAGQLDVHARRERVLGDAVVQLAGDAVPFGVEHLALARGPQLGLRGLQLGVRAWPGRRPGGCSGRAAGPSGRAARSSAAPPRSDRRGCRRTERSVSSTSRLGGRPRDEPADDPAVEPDGDVHVPAVRLGVVPGVVVGDPVDDGEQVLADLRREPRAGRSTRRRPDRARDGEGGSRPARRRPGRTPPSRRTGARPRPRRRRAPAPRSPRSCASARPRSAPVPRSPGAAARRRCGARGSSAACPSAGR